MSLTTRDIILLLQKLRELEYRQFRYTDGEVTLEVSMDAGSGAFQQAVRAPAAAEPAAMAGSAAAGPPPQQHAEKAASARRSQPPRPGLVAVSAPMSGTYYAAPSPGAPPFITEGSEVAANDTVGIIEVMKLFNSIRACTSGRVAEICVANEEQVTSGQTLVWIEPA